MKLVRAAARDLIQASGDRGDRADAEPEVGAVAAHAVQHYGQGLGPCSFRYQRQTVGAEWRQGYVDPDVVPGPKAWLETRLGMLRRFEIAG